MEEEKEVGLPLLVWIVVIGIGALPVVGFIMFLK
jgi:hypothetical protein